MLVVHAAWTSSGGISGGGTPGGGATVGGVCLWAEDATLPVGVAKGRAPRKPRPHPFGARPETLRKLFDGGVESELTLLLPSHSGGPVAAPELVRPEAGKAGKLRLLPWTVPTLEFPLGQALDVLGQEAPETPSGSWRWLAAVARFAGQLVDRGQVLPGLQGNQARWIPQLVGEDGEYARALQNAMPAVLRAEYPQGDDVFPAVLNTFADATARNRIETPRAADTVAERWLRALTTDDATVDGDLGKLETAIQAWHESAAPPAGPLRTCFRLALPDEDNEDWRVEFLPAGHVGSEPDGFGE
jgi:hypothetical protein